MSESKSEDPSRCPCDCQEFPPKPDIPAGLSSLPRQLAGFPEYRAAMLSHLASHNLLETDPSIVPLQKQRPLQNWLAREGDDLGIMLLEMWAYVLDVLSFYDERIANESYLQTAQRGISLTRLVELVGYHPRPGTAASVILSLIAEQGKGLISIPKGTAFRSAAFDGESPQVFEASQVSTIDPALNEWTLAPIRSPEFLGLITAAGDARVEEGDFLLLNWTGSESTAQTVSLTESPGSTVALLTVDQLDPASSGTRESFLVQDTSLLINDPGLGSESLLQTGLGDISDSFGGSTTITLPANETLLYAKSAQVVGTDSLDALDGASYTTIQVDPDIAPPPGTLLEEIQIRKPTLDTGLKATKITAEGIEVTLDSQQPGIRVNDLVLLVRDSESIPFRVRTANHYAKEFIVADETEDEDPYLFVTKLTLFPSPPNRWDHDPGRLRLHYGFVRAGTITRPALHELELPDLETGAALEGPVEPPEKELSGAAQFLGADGHGEELEASLSVSGDGIGTLLPASGGDPFTSPLRVPVNAYGNLVQATRGEAVSNEVLGSGDPSQAFQSFTLKKSPLTWLDDPSGTDGRRSTLEVRVNRIFWTEVPSFYGQASAAEVYIVRRNEDGESVVTFGDGSTGARLPSGVGNVTASYRHGAGAAKPPANSITQLAKAATGLRRVLNPVAAGGGSDPDSTEDLRSNASTSSLLLGRAVSLADFEALAREFGGVVNASATWTWDGRMQRAVVKLWFISDGGSIEEDLRSYLLGQSDPNVPLEASEAEAIEKPLVIDLVIDANHNSDDVEQAVIDALTDTTSGLLALENIPIGRPLFRSRVLKQVHSVSGVVSVRALRFDGAEADTALLAEEGQFLDFSNQLTVGNTAAGDTLS